MSKKQLLDLAKRVEGLSGPCRETDALIWRHLAPNECSRVESFARAMCGKMDGEDRRRAVGVEAVVRNAPAYTASLDMAMQLVPKGWQVEQVGEWYDDAFRLKGQWLAILIKPMRPMADGGSGGCADPFARCLHAARSALALTSASLRAKAAMNGG